MIHYIHELCKLQGFQYSSFVAVNGASSKIAQKNGYKQICQLDIKEKLYDNQQMYEFVEDFHRIGRYWFKQL
jgi:hypothetical protein